MILLIIGMQFLFALAFVLFKKTLSYGPPFFVVGLRMLAGAGLLLSAYMASRPRASYPTTSKLLYKNLPLILAVSICNIYITNGYALWGMQYVSAAFANFLYNLSPFVSALLGYLVLNETMNRTKFVGLVLGLIGFLPVLLTSNTGVASPEGPHLMAKAAILLSALTVAYGWIGLKKLVYEKEIPNLLANGITVLIGGILCLVHSAYFEVWPKLTSTSLGWIGLVGLLSPGICYAIYTYFLGSFSSTFMLFSGLISAFFTAIIAWLMFGEAVTAPMVISWVIVSYSLYLFYKAEHYNK